MELVLAPFLVVFDVHSGDLVAGSSYDILNFREINRESLRLIDTILTITVIREHAIGDGVVGDAEVMSCVADSMFTSHVDIAESMAYGQYCSQSSTVRKELTPLPGPS